MFAGTDSPSAVGEIAGDDRAHLQVARVADRGSLAHQRAHAYERVVADRDIRIDQALDLTQRAVSLKPDNGYYVDSLGWALFKMGRLEEALETIQRALTLVTDDPVIFEHLGEIYLKLEEREKAKEAWSRSIKLDSSNEGLIKRFRDQGFGEPGQEETDSASLPKVSQYPLEVQ